jgi:hypothetical protein
MSWPAVKERFGYFWYFEASAVYSALRGIKLETVTGGEVERWGVFGGVEPGS